MSSDDLPLSSTEVVPGPRSPNDLPMLSIEIFFDKFKWTLVIAVKVYAPGNSLVSHFTREAMKLHKAKG